MLSAHCFWGAPYWAFWTFLDTPSQVFTFWTLSALKRFSHNLERMKSLGICFPFISASLPLLRGLWFCPIYSGCVTSQQHSYSPYIAIACQLGQPLFYPHLFSPSTSTSASFSRSLPLSSWLCLISDPQLFYPMNFLFWNISITYLRNIQPYGSNSTWVRTRSLLRGGINPKQTPPKHFVDIYYAVNPILQTGSFLL